MLLTKRQETQQNWTGTNSETPHQACTRKPTFPAQSTSTLPLPDLSVCNLNQQPIPPPVTTTLDFSDTMASSPSGYDFGRYHSFEEERSGGTSMLETDGATPENMQHEQPFPSTCEPPSVWCIDCQSNQIVIGCSNGRLELWEATSGKFKVIN
jgi:hypothetical protein